MEKESTIKDLYNGRIIPCDMPVVNSIEYKQALKQCIELHDKLNDSLDEDQIQLLEDYLATNSKINILIEEQKFKDGFVLASKLLKEALE